MLYSLYTSVSARSVALILELKMHTKNRNILVHTCANFQKHLKRGREDVPRVVETSHHKTFFVFSLFSSFVETDERKSSAKSRVLPLLSSFQSSFEKLNTSRWTTPSSFFWVRFPKAYSFKVCA